MIAAQTPKTCLSAESRGGDENASRKKPKDGLFIAQQLHNHHILSTIYIEMGLKERIDEGRYSWKLCKSHAKDGH
jgi:hypothetical protein